MNLHEAKRPVLVLGAGIHQGHAEREAVELANLLQIPVCLTWGFCDGLPESSPLRIGTFGTHGTRAANFAVQNADFLLCIGTRLDTKATGTPAKWFAREAYIVMVDIDQAEIDKMSKIGVKVDGVCMDAKEYIRAGCPQVTFGPARPEGVTLWRGYPDVSDWLARCQDWKRRYPPVLPEYEREDGINPYVLIRELSRIARPDDIIVCDTGCAIAWTCQAWEFKEGQRLLHCWNQTPMGYALPAAVGAHYATGKRVICIVGDGAIMMSIGELATIGRNTLPIKILLLENGGHAMCRQTEREWLDGKYCGTSTSSGLTFPDFEECAEPCGILADEVRKNEDASFMLDWLFQFDIPQLLVAHIHPDADVIPKAKYGHANEDQHPLLPREVLAAEMIVPMVGA